MLSVKPKKAEAVLFYSQLPDGQPDRMSQHGGCPVLLVRIHCTELHCTVLHYTTLYCAILYSTVMYFTVLHCIVLYCTALH